MHLYIHNQKGKWVEKEMTVPYGSQAPMPFFIHGSFIVFHIWNIIFPLTFQNQNAFCCSLEKHVYKTLFASVIYLQQNKLTSFIGSKLN